MRSGANFGSRILVDWLQFALLLELAMNRDFSIRREFAKRRHFQLEEAQNSRRSANLRWPKFTSVHGAFRIRYGENRPIFIPNTRGRPYFDSYFC